MKILVAVKRVVDPNVRIRVRPDGSAIDTTDLKTALNPFDEVAVEQAVRLKEAGQATDVVLVSVGPAAAKDTLRAGLALGADRGILIEGPAELEPLAVARLLAEVVKKQEPALVLLGKQSIDADAAQCGPMLAAMLGWAQVTFASQLQLSGQELHVTRDAESGSEVVALALPAVVTADLRLAEPRYATLPNVMAARRKPIETLKAGDLVAADQLAPRHQVLSVVAADTQRHVVLVADAAELVNRLRSEAKVLKETA
jgi:electron transfer flavoprotein beta subunit